MTDRRPPFPTGPDDAVLEDARTRPSEPPADPGLLGNAVAVLRSPTAAYRTIAAREPVGQAIAVVLIAVALMTAVQVVEAVTDPAAPTALIPLAVGGGLLGIVSFAVWSGAVLLCAKVLGGSGGYRGTFTGLGFAYVPLVLGAIIALATLPFGPVAGTLWVLAIFLATVWSFVLDVLAVREVHGLSTGRAVAAVLLPIVVIGVLIVLLFFTVLVAWTAGM